MSDAGVPYWFQDACAPSAATACFWAAVGAIAPLAAAMSGVAAELAVHAIPSAEDGIRTRRAAAPAASIHASLLLPIC